ncbi:MAG TPA: glycoside hydrolase family 3 C-terminal domain-containing protein, partial [Terriglobales bacterium]|nr:glycoside hydrolase family 3 C-terminal domain-containing protein [Terriglobales bacterium]
PNVNIFRDPRWGRGQETYGEDPYLSGRMAVAFVTGMQGDDPHYLKTIATPKHFAVHSGPEVLRHAFDVPLSTHDLADTYTPAFRAGVVEAKAGSVMCAYNSLGGQPACANSTLTHLLRGTWKFDGYVVSDCGAVGDIYRGHDYRKTLEQASATAVSMGTDLDCGTEYRSLGTAISNHLLDDSALDVAVTRLFTARFRLGMFDPPEMVPWSKLTLADNDTAAHRKLALEAARQSLVLLRNNGVLPLRGAPRTIAVIGPNADSEDVLLGNYNGIPSRSATVLQGIRQRFPQATVLSAPGSLLIETSALPVPSSALRTADRKPGLRGDYYANDTLTGTPLLTRVDPNVDFDWAESAPAAGMPATHFSVRWSGELVPPVSGEYRLGGAADDGFRLWLDDTLLVDDWGSHDARAVTTSMQLQAGRAYKLRMEYWQKDWGDVARLLWQPPNLQDDALAAAKKADVVIAVAGISPQLEGEESSVSAPGFFGGDRVDIDLPKPQQQLLESLATTGKPLIVVLMNGSALAVSWAQQHAAAILEAWYPGEEGGSAVAQALAGDFSPAGRLPVTFYKSVADLPPFDDYSMIGRTYRYFHGAPLYAFGFGLSYTSFAYSGARVDHASIAAGDTVTVSVEVKNTGKIDSDEVVELYLSQPGLEDRMREQRITEGSSPVAIRTLADNSAEAIRTLAGFTRIHLRAGESRTVSIPVHEREYSVVDNHGTRIIVPGTVDVWIGGGQPPAAGAKTQFQITSAKELPE